MECQHCGSKKVILKGMRRGKQRYKCLECGKWFSEKTEKAEEKSKTEKQNPLISKILERYSEEELRAIANGKSINPTQLERPIVNFDGEQVSIAFVNDTHIGSKFFEDFLWFSFLEECKKQKVSRILFGGDVIEGMSNRPDHVYSLTDIGFSAQMEHAARLISMATVPVDAIDGNHDRWGIKSGGLFAVKEIAKQVPNMTFLGHDCADVIINGTKWRLWHGEDGNSYATSYRVQKIIESLTGGSKPNVLLCGHTHKQVYMFERNIHAISGGALSYQSDWMRSKRYACHTGFHIIKAVIRDEQIISFTPTFYPFYN